MFASGQPFVSLIIPAYHEAQRLAASVAALRAYLTGVDWPHEILLVIERSTDGTLELARALTTGLPSFRILAHDVQRGKGHAVREGMLAARGDIAFFMDADLSTPLAEIGRFLAQLAAQPEVDVLIGNRQHAHSAILRRQSLPRRKMGETFNAILRLLAGIRVRDTQCGFKAFRRRAVDAIFPRQTLDGFAFDVEVLLLAERLGLRVEDMPVEWTNADGSKVHILRDSLRMLRDALRVRGIVERTLGD